MSTRLTRRDCAFVVAALAGAAALPALAEHTTDTLEMVKKGLVEKKAVIVDVREADEWEDGHLREARHLPMSSLKQIDKEAVAKVLPKDKVIYLHCQAGGRCQKVADLLEPLGYDVRALKPGYPDLVEAGFPATKGK
ncbi:MAG: rhodanese-like domain-containing protein [Planctomycetes bacterium]|nr:rhodanese-like domain-containing protein [Planctomycetota bacterium]